MMVAGGVPLVLRAAPGCHEDVAALAAMGITARALPLMRQRDAAGDAAGDAALNAVIAEAVGDERPILLTSRRAVAAMADAPSRGRARIWCVGPATASAARGAGLTVTRQGAGSLRALLADVEPRPLLWLAGDPRQPVPDGWAGMVAVRTVYRMESAVPADDAGGVARQLAGARMWVLHSVGVARIAASLVPDAASRSAIRLCAISPAVADAAGEGTEEATGPGGWAGIDVPERPDRAALLALVARICQSHGPRPPGA